MPRFLLWILVLSSILVSTSPEAQEPVRLALLIGNKDYTGKVQPLKNPFNDINAVGTALTTIGFKVTLLPDASRLQMLSAVGKLAVDLAKGGPSAIGFLYYSGHGVARPEDRANYLIPIDLKDTNSTDFWHAAVKLDDILGELERAAPFAAHFIIVDACRDELKLPYKSASKGFEPVAERSGMFIAFATALGAVALDESKIGSASGPYSAALAKELLRPGQDHLQLFQNVKEAVFATTARQQVPWERNGLLRRVYFGGESAASTLPQSSMQSPIPPFVSGDPEWDTAFAAKSVKAFEIYLNLPGPRPHAREAREAIADLTYYEVADKAGKLANLEDYLNKYPKGLMDRNARASIEKLKRAELEKACAAYAGEALKQIRESTSLGCQQHGAAQWLANELAQRQWCLSTTAEEQLKEIELRKSAIDGCRLSKQEAELWAKATKASNAEIYAAYAKAFPTGPNALEAKKRLDALDHEAFVKISEKEDFVATVESYLQQFPQGRHVGEARQLREDGLAWATATKAKTADAYRDYITKFPHGRYAEEAGKKLESIRLAERQADDKIWAEAEKKNTVVAYETYLKVSKVNLHAAQAKSRIAALTEAALQKTCAAYAEKAVMLARENQRVPCGETGERWALDASIHVTFCRNANPADREAVDKVRSERVHACTAPERDDKQWREADSIPTLGKYLRDWPQGRHVPEAQTKLISLCEAKWIEARKDSWQAMSLYADGYCSESKFSGDARNRRNSIDEAAWKIAKAANDKAAYEKYLQTTGDGDGKYAQEASAITSDYEAWESAKEIAELESYLENHKNGRFVRHARAKIEALKQAAREQEDRDWSKAQLEDSVPAYQTYQQTWPEGRFFKQAATRIDGLEQLLRANTVFLPEVIDPAAADVAPDGSRLAVSYRNGLLLLFDTHTGKLIHTVRGSQGEEALRFSGDGRWLVLDRNNISSNDEQRASHVRVVDLASGQVVKTFAGYSLAGASNNGQAISIERNNENLYWDLSGQRRVSVGDFEAANSVRSGSPSGNHGLSAEIVRSNDISYIALTGPTNSKNAEQENFTAEFVFLANSQYHVEDGQRRYTGSDDINRHLKLAIDDVEKSMTDEYRKRFYKSGGLKLWGGSR